MIPNMLLKSAFLLSFALRAFGQTASSYTDSITGISFQRYLDATGFSFGMALPVDVGSDFIGQLVVPTNGSGYGGVSMGATMADRLLIVAYPNNDAVVASFREASGYTSPTIYSGEYSPSMSPISNGTFVNSTHLVYTWVCHNCITNDSLTFDPDETATVMGWALSSSAVSDQSSTSATLQYHNTGFGEFGLTLSAAQSASYSTWAAMASVSGGNGTTTNGTTTTGSSNSTCSTSSSSNITATISNTTYDYIVAGAGPAGIIVAERLAETGKSVLLIERGTASTYASGGPDVESWNDTVTQYDVPAMSYYLTNAADTSEYCTDTASEAGCLLGGGTMVNALMFVRPQEADFNDKWPVGWKWEDVEPAAERLYARNPGTTLASADGKRYDQSVFTILSSFLSSIGWSHIDAIASPNDKHNAYSYPPWDTQDGLRAGPVTSYYPLAEALSNFSINLNTKVIRAVRNGTYVSGVEIEMNTGERQIININTGGKVILAAGALSTPRILFNSGIGPTAQISTVASGCTDVTLPAESNWIDLPVGENIRDHPIFTLLFNTTSNLTSMSATDFEDPSATNIDLFAKASGPLAQSGQRLNFWTSLTNSDGTRFFQGTCNSPSAGTVRIKLYLTHGATSSGSLGITSEGATTFTTQPWMNTDADKTAAAAMIDSLLASVKNSSILTYSDSTATGATIIENYISGDHFVGTAPMSRGNDTSAAVVDTNTKVLGMDNLFVVDASIHPDLPTGNTQAIVMVVAEHAAAKIIALGSTNSTSGNSSVPATTSTVASGVLAVASSSIIPPYPIVTGSNSATLALSSEAAVPTATATTPENAITSSAAIPTNIPTFSSSSATPSTKINIQPFTGRLGGIPPAVFPYHSSGSQKYSVRGKFFSSINSALRYSCSVQQQACANAMRRQVGGTARCDVQQTRCRAVASTAVPSGYVTGTESATVSATGAAASAAVRPTTEGRSRSVRREVKEVEMRGLNYGAELL